MDGPKVKVKVKHFNVCLFQVAAVETCSPRGAGGGG